MLTETEKDPPQTRASLAYFQERKRIWAASCRGKISALPEPYIPSKSPPATIAQKSETDGVSSSPSIRSTLFPANDDEEFLQGEAILQSAQELSLSSKASDIETDSLIESPALDSPLEKKQLSVPSSVQPSATTTFQFVTQKSAAPLSSVSEPPETNTSPAPAPFTFSFSSQPFTGFHSVSSSSGANPFTSLSSGNTDSTPSFGSFGSATATTKSTTSTPFGTSFGSFGSATAKSTGPTPFGSFGAATATSFSTTSTPFESFEPKQTSSYRDRLVAFYKKHNPQKISSVDLTLEKYKGKEDDLFRRLEQKYATYPKAAGKGPEYWLETSMGRIHVRVFSDKVPNTAANFGTLCTGTPVSPANHSNIITFRNTPIHRIVPNQLVQGGDTTVGNGTGGRSAFDAPLANDMWGHFDDEEFMAHDRAGLLSMANTGPNSNSSQFFITCKAMPHLNGKHVVFGEVSQGMQVIQAMVQLPIDSKQRPLEEVKILDCGRV